MLTFQDLYDSYAAELNRFALWLTGDPARAEDIASETLIRAWIHKDRIRTETLKAYLLTIARNLYLERGRRRRRQAALTEGHPDPAPGPERVAQARLELARVRALLNTLPEIDRSAFVLRVQHELPYAEVARVLGLSLSAARVKVYRVRKRLLADWADEKDG